MSNPNGNPQERSDIPTDPLARRAWEQEQRRAKGTGHPEREEAKVQWPGKPDKGEGSK